MLTQMDNLMISLYVSCILIFWFYVTEIMKKSKIISSESDASVKVKQKQNTDIDFHIRPPSVNFQPCAMADLATMAPPGIQKPSTFAPPMDLNMTARPVVEKRETPLLTGLRRPGAMNGLGNGILTANLTLPGTQTQPQSSMSQPVDGALLQTSDQQTNKVSTFHEEEDKEPVSVIEHNEPIETIPIQEPTVQEAIQEQIALEVIPELAAQEVIAEPIQKQEIPETVIPAPVAQEPIQKLDKIINGPYIEKPAHVTIKNKPINVKPAANTVKEIKKPEPPQKNEENEQMRRLLQEKTRDADVLEALLDIYKNKHKIINGLLVCQYNQLIQLVKAQCGADKVEIITDEEGGCTIKKRRFVNVESIVVNVNGKSYDFRYGFPDQYATLARHGVDIKRVLV